MKAIILVGGEGTRMRPLTLHTPKPLLPIANVPFIQRQIQWLSSFGVDDVVLSLGYLPDAFEEYFYANPVEGVTISYAVEEEPLGTGGAIRYAASECEDDIIVCNGDVLTDLDLSELISFHKVRDSIATIALTYVEDPSAFGVVPTKGDGEVIAFVEKPPRENAPSHWINAGLYVLTPEFLDLIPKDINVSIERETFPLALHNGKMFALNSDAYWIDIGTPNKYLQAHSDYLANPMRFGEHDDITEKLPSLYVDGDVQIGKEINIEASSLVGAGTIIGNNVILNGATLGPRCVIEDNVIIRNSVVMSGTKIDNNTTLDSSIVGPLSHIGHECLLLDHCIVGAHEKIEPQCELASQRIGSIV